MMHVQCPVAFVVFHDCVQSMATVLSIAEFLHTSVCLCWLVSASTGYLEVTEEDRVKLVL